MLLQYKVTVELAHSSGLFASKDELGQILFDLLDDANPYDLTGEDDGEYAVTHWAVEEL